MNNKTTLKVSKNTHALVLKSKKHLKKAFEGSDVKVQVDNDFAVKRGAKALLDKKLSEIGAIK